MIAHVIGGITVAGRFVVEPVLILPGSCLISKVLTLSIPAKFLLTRCRSLRRASRYRIAKSSRSACIWQVRRRRKTRWGPSVTDGVPSHLGKSLHTNPHCRPRGHTSFGSSGDHRGPKRGVVAPRYGSGWMRMRVSARIFRSDDTRRISGKTPPRTDYRPIPNISKRHPDSRS